MNDIPIRWRPLGSRDLEATCALLMQAIRPWQDEWFPGRFLRVEALDPIGPFGEVSWPEVSHTGRVWSCGPDVRLSATRGALAPLVNRALDLPESFSIASNSRDVLLLDIEAKLADELLEVLRRTLSPVASGVETLSSSDVAESLPVPYGAARFRLVTESGDTVMSVLCGAPTLWACVPLQPDIPKERRTPLEPRSEATSRSKVFVQAMLGQCELTAQQLATLAVGDVIILDRSIHDPVALVLEPADRMAPAFVATARPGQRAGKLSIQLHEIASTVNP